MPSQSSSSTPSGAASTAARRSCVLCESARRLPETARIRMGLGLLRLHERELGDELHVVAEVVAAALVRRIPVDAVGGAVDRRLELEAEALAAERVDLRCVGDRALEPDRPGRPLDRELALTLDLVAVELAELGGLELDLRIALGVEEVRRLQVPVELLVLHVDARDLRRALEARAGERGGEVPEAAAEVVDARVGDLERDVRVDRVGVPDTDRCDAFDD